MQKIWIKVKIANQILNLGLKRIRKIRRKEINHQKRRKNLKENMLQCLTFRGYLKRFYKMNRNRPNYRMKKKKSHRMINNLELEIRNSINSKRYFKIQAIKRIF